MRERFPQIFGGKERDFLVEKKRQAELERWIDTELGNVIGLVGQESKETDSPDTDNVEMPGNAACNRELARIKRSKLISEMLAGIRKSIALCGNDSAEYLCDLIDLERALKENKVSTFLKINAN